jgi:hypothetical protein
LSREAMTGLVVTNQSEIYEDGGFPIQQRFMRGNGGNLRLVSAEKIVIEFKRMVRKLGKWQAKPGDPTPLEWKKFGVEVAQTAYKAVSDTLPANHFAAMRQAGTPNDVDPGSITALANAAALDWVNSFTKAGTEHHLRDFEWLLVQMLTTASFNWTIDGAVIPCSTGLTIGTAPGGVAWTSNSAKIASDLAIMRKQFILQAGRAPDTIDYSFELSEELAKNDQIIDIAKRHGAVEADPITGLPLFVLPGDLRSAEIVEHKGIYDATDLTKTNMWPHYIVTMSYLGRDPESVCEAYTVPTEADMNRGGLWAATDTDNLTKRTTAAVGFNGFGATKDRDRIMSWDVSTV